MHTDRPPTRTDALVLHLLVLRCQAGDEAAFARLVERFGPRTQRYLQRLVGGDAEDVQQDVWLAVYRRIGQLVTPAAFVTWLFRLARNEAVDCLRRRRRASELMQDVAVESAAHGEASGDPDDQPEALDLDALSNAIATLAAMYREVIVLRYQEELSYAEIATVAGCSIGTVKSRLHHARRQLQHALAGVQPTSVIPVRQSRGHDS